MTTFIRKFFFITIFSGLMTTNVFALDYLNLKVRTNYPASMTTVYDAVRYILEPTGYEVTLISPYAKDAYEISAKPITPMARTRRTMTIYDAIQALIGVDNTIVVDHKNKEISFLKGLHTNESIIKKRQDNE